MGYVWSKILYIPPSPPRYDIQSFKNNLIWIPLEPVKQQITKETIDTNNHKINYIPCLFCYNKNAHYQLVYCHGNAVDLGTIYAEMAQLCKYTKCHILCMEYPGYGQHKGEHNEETFNQSQHSVIKYVCNTMKIPQKQIIFYGRSIGSAVCCRVVAELTHKNSNKKEQIGGLIMHSGFTSINDLFQYHSHINIVATKLYNSIHYIKYVECPCLFIHGIKDTLVPYEHSKGLFDTCSSDKKYLMLFPNADHNNFNYIREVINPIVTFLDMHVVHGPRLQLLNNEAHTISNCKDTDIVSILRDDTNITTSSNSDEDEDYSDDNDYNRDDLSYYNNESSTYIWIPPEIFKVPTSVADILPPIQNIVFTKVSSIYNFLCGTNNQNNVNNDITIFRIPTYIERTFNKLPNPNLSTYQRAKHFCSYSYRSAMLYLNSA